MAKINYLALNDTLRPINKNTVKSIERNSAQYIYVNKDRVAKCERCDNEFSLPNVKHHEMAKCPKCHRSFEVIHTWRKSKNESIHWEIVGSAATETTFVLRYYKVERNNGQITNSNECARMFINTDRKEICKVENNFWTGSWEKNGYHYFREFGMCYARNRYFCMDGTVRRNAILKELKKIPALKYLDIESLWTSKYYAHALSYIIPRASLYEKLQKVGLTALVKADMDNYIDSDEIKFNRTHTELTKMLGISKASLNLLKIAPTLKALKILQDMPNITEVEFVAFKDSSISQINSMNEISKKIGFSTVKIANYILKQGATIGEYKTYIDKLTKLNYKITEKSYAFPKDFVADLARVTFEEMRGTSDKRNALIREISEKLMKNPQLKDFFTGKNGYMIYSPMSEEEFIAEGIVQHNCVGKMGYAERMANNKTLVFFVREMSNPKAPFITMEYRDGRIQQCMLKYNKRVDTDTKVYDFCSQFAKRLNDCKILSA